MTAVSFVADDVRLLFGGVDLALHSKKFSAATSTEEKDATTFRIGTILSNTPNSAKVVRGGLESTQVKFSGLGQAGSTNAEGMPDDEAWGVLSARSLTPITYLPNGGALGDIAYFGAMAVTKNQIVDGGPGDLWTFDVEGVASYYQRGAISLPVTAATSSGHATGGVHLGAIPAGTRLWASFHALAVPTSGGGSISWEVQSSSTSDFASHTTVITGSTSTARGGEVLHTTGGTEITDTYFRTAWTVTGGTGGTFIIAGAVAAQ